jgi:YetA-like protein
LSGIEIPIHLEDRDRLHRQAETIRVGVPLPPGRVYDLAELVVTNAAGVLIPHQFEALAFWADRSIKWLLVNALARVSAQERTQVFVRARAHLHNCEPRTLPLLQLSRNNDVIEIDTGVCQFTIRPQHGGPVSAVRVGGFEALQGVGSLIRLMPLVGSVHELDVERFVVEEQGPFRVTILAEGGFRGASALPLRFKMRTVFTAGTAILRIDLQIRNTGASMHPGGLWDLGDPGSCLFKDLTLACFPRSLAGELTWHVESPGDERTQRMDRWAVYQDSSGGEQWQSPNHIDRHSQPTVSFCGYRVTGGPKDALLAEGKRATPVVTVAGEGIWVAAAVQGFWENFPKALRWENSTLEVGVFPREARGGFELQGGEQKRHTVLLDFGTTASQPCLAQLQRPLELWIEPAWVEATGAITWFSARAPDDDPTQARYVEQIIEGSRSFCARRELIDEYGWRNFGDLYADHEAVHHRGPKPFISHYNNQYDFVYGAFLNFMRTGDGRWRRLMEDAVRHHIDIDIYHTEQDRAAFNGGLFWHTDHYKPAATSTHRTYSRSNAGSRAYGGGPSNEHNYTSGLLHYYYLSGDREAAASVRELADWVFGLDDGARTVFGLIDANATGGASKTVESSYHHAGRGSGNSINALLDAYTVSRERRYLEKAQEILQRCIHPADEIGALKLDDPEHRWSYLVFLQVIGKFLEKKREIGEIDYTFHYARASLLHYAAWMAENEVPFKDVLHKVELPTETWPAHDIRKCHVLNVAAGYATGAQREPLRERAKFFFERCLGDLMSFPTANLTRPLVILSVYGSIQDYFRKHVESSAEFSVHNHDFGAPNVFIPQRARLKSTIGSRVRVLSVELSRILADKLYAVKLRLRRSG